ncbi:hypothetical protein GDO86_010992 [Hymenochirus boettgeri]|uniref:Uncharacterized protein n=1 Tax=Hymenochirus boettgeri TaxID=247094 RepID=A0A8T2JFF2_9PIPI|nr:hypothetical protein GDO86_010992 [Hymenochirus boettgeri]
MFLLLIKRRYVWDGTVNWEVRKGKVKKRKNTHKYLKEELYSFSNKLLFAPPTVIVTDTFPISDNGDHMLMKEDQSIISHLLLESSYCMNKIQL